MKKKEFERSRGFSREIWCSNLEIRRFDEKLGDSQENLRRVGRHALEF